MHVTQTDPIVLMILHSKQGAVTKLTALRTV